MSNNYQLLQHTLYCVKLNPQNLYQVLGQWSEYIANLALSQKNLSKSIISSLTSESASEIDKIVIILKWFEQTYKSALYTPSSLLCASPPQAIDYEHLRQDLEYSKNQKSQLQELGSIPSSFSNPSSSAKPSYSEASVLSDFSGVDFTAFSASEESFSLNSSEYYFGVFCHTSPYDEQSQASEYNLTQQQSIIKFFDLSFSKSLIPALQEPEFMVLKELAE